MKLLEATVEAQYKYKLLLKESEAKIVELKQEIEDIKAENMGQMDNGVFYPSAPKANMLDKGVQKDDFQAKYYDNWDYDYHYDNDHEFSMRYIDIFIRKQNITAKRKEEAAERKKKKSEER